MGRLLLVPTWALVIALVGIAAAHVLAFDHARFFMLADSYTLWIYLPAYAIGVAVSANLNFDNRDHGPLLAEIARDDADVVVLEELTPEWWNAVEASSLWSSHPYRVGEPRSDPGGMAVLSREPLRDVVVRRADGWPIITAAVVVDHTTVHLAGVHLVAPLDTFSRNQRQQRAITAIIRALPRPRIVAGDFNADPYNRWYEQIRHLGLREAHEAVGRSLATTWPNGQHHLPPLRLDHVFVDAPLLPLRATEGRGTGSDHRPIVVDLAITGSVEGTP